MQRRSYPSDLSEQEWAILEPLIPPAKPGGHPRTTEMREVLNGVTIFHGDPTMVPSLVSIAQVSEESACPFESTSA